VAASDSLRLYVCKSQFEKRGWLGSGSTPILIASVKVRNTAYSRRRRREVFCELFPICILSSIKKGCAASSLHPAISYLGTAVICAFGSVAKRGASLPHPYRHPRNARTCFWK